MRELTISFGKSNPAVITHVNRTDWGSFASWLTAVPPEVSDKAAEGWYLPAEFNPVYRDSENFVARHAITFDFDHVGTRTWNEMLEVWSDLAFAAYTTFSHRADRPRFRCVLPLNRPAGFDEYQAVARKVGCDVGLELVARESFVPAQMMFCPTRPVGGVFKGHVNEGEWLDVDSVLSEYADWRDVSQWPRRRDGDPVHAGTEKADPLEKPGIIGAFNRAFSIEDCTERGWIQDRRVR